ncbi:MAG: NUDIX domain-containing protein [Oscillospiraceae bacterium]
MELTERTVEHTRPYEGVIVKVDLDKALLPNGRTAKREVVDHPGGVAVLPLNDDGTVTVVRQYRYPFSQVLTEIPAGKLDPGEEPRTGALRELKEEVGAQAGELIDLGAIYPSPGFCREVLYLYLARGLTYGDCCPDADEFLEVARVPFDSLAEQVMSGEIRDGKTVAAVLKAKVLLKR